MIVVLGVPSEPPVAMLADALDRAGQPFVMVDQLDSLDHHLDYVMVNGRPVGTLRIGDRTIDLDDIDSLYARLSDHRVLPDREGLDAADPAAVHIDRLHERWIHLLDVLDALVVNRLCAMGSNSSKSYQTELINRAGLRTPPTLATSDPARARRFVDDHVDPENGERGVIFKSVSGIRSIVRTVTDADVERLDRVGGCPTQFQAFVPGDDVRVHVVGDEVIATRIRSDAQDYRYARLETESADLEPFDLDDDLADRCRAVTRELGLHFSGIDLRMSDPDGHGDPLGGGRGGVVCFEVNPSPAYSYYEANTGQPISDALAALLAA